MGLRTTKKGDNARALIIPDLELPRHTFLIQLGQLSDRPLCKS